MYSIVHTPFLFSCYSIYLSMCRLFHSLRGSASWLGINSFVRPSICLFLSLHNFRRYCSILQDNHPSL